jgi:hypothetical protein
MPRDSVTGLPVSSNRLRAMRRLVSYHEAGHAVIARALGVEVADISMAPGADASAVARVLTRSCAFAARDADKDAFVVAVETDLKVSLAGQAAEKVAGYPPRDRDAPDEGDGVTTTSAAVILACLQSGLSVDDAPEEIAPDDPLRALASAIIDRAFEETVALTRKHYPAIVRVAAVLQRGDYLSATDLDRLIAGGDARRRDL